MHICYFNILLYRIILFSINMTDGDFLGQVWKYNENNVFDKIESLVFIRLNLSLKRSHCKWSPPIMLFFFLRDQLYSFYHTRESNMHTILTWGFSFPYLSRKVAMVMEPPLASNMELFDSFDPFLAHFSGFSMLIEKLFSIHVVWTLLSGSVPKSICNSIYLNKDYGSLVILITNYS